MPLTLKKFNKRPLPYKTFTITWTEQSNMSSGWTYSDDASGLTAGSTEFDKFFGYSGVRLNTNGVETAEITQENSGGYGKLNITQLGTITSGDNVMIKFPIRGIKMTKSGSVVTLSITDGLNRESEGYQYYAFQTGQINNITGTKNCFYLGAYKAYNSSNVLKSWSGQSPAVSLTQANFCSYAKANNSNKLRNIEGFYQRMYVNALYMMKYGNPYCISTIGYGYTGGNSKVNTGGSNGNYNATYGTSSKTVQMKLFGLEDWYGNIYECLGGCYTDGNKNLYTQLSGYSGYNSGGVLAGSINRGSYYCLTSIAGDNNLMFAPKNTLNTTGYTSYYRTHISVYTNKILTAGCAWDAGEYGGPGVLNLYYLYDTTSKDTYTGARLMFLPD